MAGTRAPTPQSRYAGIRVGQASVEPWTVQVHGFRC